MRRSILCCLLFLMLVPATGRADLDVTVPPGLPPDWMRSIPRPALTDLGLVPTRRAGDGKNEGSVEVMPVEQRPKYTGRSENTLGFSGITTQDLPMELRWSSPVTTQLKRQKVALTGPDAGDGTIKYPPPFPTHLYWLSQATLLRKFLHPSQVSLTQTLQHLIRLGHPAYLAASNARRENATREAAQYLVSAIGPLQNKSVRPLPHRDPYVAMLHRLAASELASGYPYAPDRRFARRLLSLGLEAQRPVLAYTRHQHRFVRRNAVAVLAQFHTPTAASRLRELLDDKDLVVRNRALAGLVAQRDTGCVPWLIKALDRGDNGLRVLAADALGRIGDARGLAPVLKYARRRHRDADALWAAIPALVRLAPRDKAVVGLLRSLEAFYRTRKDYFDKDARPSWIPVRQDTLTRAQVTAQMCRIGLAAGGDDAAGAAVVAALRGRNSKLPAHVEKMLKRMPPKRRAALRRRWLARIPGYGQLGTIASVNGFLVCEALGRMGADASQRLLAVIRNGSLNTALRAHALAQLDPDVAFGFVESLDKLAELAKQTTLPGLVRARALWMLEDRDAELALKTSRAIVRRYADGTPSYEALKQDWVVIPAMRLIGRRATGDPDLLARVVRRAQRENIEARVLRANTLKGRNAGYIQQGRYGKSIILTVPPVLEVALLELGRTGKPKAGEVLREQLGHSKNPARPEAAIALGAIGGKDSCQRLVQLLADTDPFVRFNAYRALRKLANLSDWTGYFADWLYGRPFPRSQAAGRWARWLARTFPK